jgi:cytochrome b
MKTVKVWDPFVRLFHWSLAAFVLASFLTSDRDALVPLHVRIGLAIVLLVLARIAWGALGPRPARFSSFVRGPRATFGYARAMLRGRPPAHLSHNPLGGAMVVTMVIVLLAVAATGALVYAGPEFDGPLTGVLSRREAKAMKEVHEVLSGGLVVLVVVHVAGVLVSSALERQNLVAGMITGWKRAPAGHPAPARTSIAARVAGTLLAGAVAALAVAVLLGVPLRSHAAGGVAAELLREYEGSARQRHPAFRGFSAEDGRRIYLAESTMAGEAVSYATCHTRDPRARGRTPVGKVVEPLAPAANPDRFTDRGEVEKWFKRNCKQVIGRECTAAEKGHFLTFLLGS